ncbi:MAG: hypothetical protein EOP38_27420 [Rubrivivax sp.]|nr:MAG: hypothetical protein EOP38_27420 [Rubrivivax sp.]
MPRPTQSNCTTAEQRATQGQHCRPRIQNSGSRNIEPQTPPLSFNMLWANYPKDSPYVGKDGKPPAGYENQCAIKVSLSMQASGVNMGSFKGATVNVAGKKLAIRAEELARWIKVNKPAGLLTPVNLTGADWKAKGSGKKGIIYFANYWRRDGEKTPSGDHIDLWNESRLTSSGLWGGTLSVLRFGLGVESIDGVYSDLGKATEILLWEV